MIKTTCKKCRRLGVSLCGKAQCALTKRPTPPGQHGKAFRRGGSEFGQQLAEKQKVKYTYGLRERQFRKYFDAASKSKGMTSLMLARLLETRLDNVVFRLGFASSRSQAHQMAGHGHFTVNGRRVNVPSFMVKPGDRIVIRQGSAAKKLFADAKTFVKKHETPVWLELDKETLVATMKRQPEAEELVLPFNMQLITEFYSR